MGSTKKLNNDEVDKKLKGTDIIRIGDYISSHIRIEWECAIDKYRWFAMPYNIIRNKKGCPKCAKQIRITNEEVDRRLKDENRQIIRIGNFITQCHSIEWKCLRCDRIWKTVPYAILNDHQGCMICSTKEKYLTNEYVDNFIKDKPIERIGNYVDTLTKIKWKCKYDKCQWETTFIEIRKGHGCPVCKRKKRKEIIKNNERDLPYGFY
jgi:hypothetical protein